MGAVSFGKPVNIFLFPGCRNYETSVPLLFSIYLIVVKENGDGNNDKREKKRKRSKRKKIKMKKKTNGDNMILLIGVYESYKNEYV